MSLNKFVHVGKIHSPQGVRGDLFIYIFSEEASWMDQWKKLSISDPKQDQPQRHIEILKVKAHQKQKKPGFVLSLKGINDRNLSEALIGQKVYIPEEFLVSEEGETMYLREVLHFRVIDQTRGDVGEIVSFMDTGFQDLLVIQNSKQEEFEVPFIEPLLVEIKMESKEVIMDIPYGLVPGEEL